MPGFGARGAREEASRARHAGHGLHLENVRPVARLPHMTELNIGHSIISRAIFVGLERAVQEMRDSIRAA